MLGNLILASTAASSSSSSSGSTTFLLIIVVLIVAMYFLMIRPQRNRQRKLVEQQRAVAPGQRIRTTAGMYATVVDVDGDDVVLEIAPGVHSRYTKRAIMEVLGDDVPVTNPGEAGYATDFGQDHAPETGEHADGHTGDESRTADTF